MATVKTAYRRRAKELHPDHNPSPSAAEEFVQLSEAWAVVGDSGKRRAYDASLTKSKVKAKPAGPSRSATGHRGPQRTTEAYNATAQAASQAYAAHPEPPPPPRPPPARLRGCERCGVITAQPRFVSFPEPPRPGLLASKRMISAVYCSRCADIIGLQTAMSVWLYGWWRDPRASLAIWRITLRGGLIPARENYLLLMRHARGFFQRGEVEVAHGIAGHALGFARTSEQQQEARGLGVAMLAHANRPPRPLRDRWRGVTALRFAQLSPLFALVVVIAVGIRFTPPLPVPTLSGLAFFKTHSTDMAEADIANDGEDEAAPPSATTISSATSAKGTTPLVVEGGGKVAGTSVWVIPDTLGTSSANPAPGATATPPIPPLALSLSLPSPFAQNSPIANGAGQNANGQNGAGQVPPPKPDIARLTLPAFLRTGELYAVTVAGVPVRSGPASQFSTLGSLDGTAVVMVIENSEAAGWVKVMTADNQTGYVLSRFLTAAPPDQGLHGALKKP